MPGLIGLRGRAKQGPAKGSCWHTPPRLGCALGAAAVQSSPGGILSPSIRWYTSTPSYCGRYAAAARETSEQGDEAVLPQTARNDPCCNSEYLTDRCEQYHGDISLGRCLLSRCLGRPGVPLQENDPSG